VCSAWQSPCHRPDCMSSLSVSLRPSSVRVSSEAAGGDRGRRRTKATEGGRNPFRALHTTGPLPTSGKGGFNAPRRGIRYKCSVQQVRTGPSHEDLAHRARARGAASSHGQGGHDLRRYY